MPDPVVEDELSLDVVVCLARGEFNKDNAPVKGAVLKDIIIRPNRTVQAWVVEVTTLQQLVDIMRPNHRLPSDFLLPDGRGWARTSTGSAIHITTTPKVEPFKVDEDGKTEFVPSMWQGNNIRLVVEVGAIERIIQHAEYSTAAGNAKWLRRWSWAYAAWRRLKYNLFGLRR